MTETAPYKTLLDSHESALAAEHAARLALDRAEVSGSNHPARRAAVQAWRRAVDHTRELAAKIARLNAERRDTFTKS